MTQKLFKVIADGFTVHIVAKDENDVVSLCESCFDFSKIHLGVVYNNFAIGEFPRFASLSEINV